MERYQPSLPSSTFHLDHPAAHTPSVDNSTVRPLRSIRCGSVPRGCRGGYRRKGRRTAIAATVLEQNSYLGLSTTVTRNHPQSSASLVSGVYPRPAATIIFPSPSPLTHRRRNYDGAAAAHRNLPPPDPPQRGHGALAVESVKTFKPASLLAAPRLARATAAVLLSRAAPHPLRPEFIPMSIQHCPEKR